VELVGVDEAEDPDGVSEPDDFSAEGGENIRNKMDKWINK
jgi:hypothetical protein